MKDRAHWFWLTAAALAVGTALAVSGCFAKDKPPAVPAPVGEEEAWEEPPLLIGVSIYRYNDDFMDLYRRELKKYLEETYQARVIVRDARDDRRMQEDQVGAFIGQGCDAMIVNPVKISSVPRIADQCREAGIPVVFINREPAGAEVERWRAEGIRAAYIGTDSRQAGSYQGEIVLETPKKGDFNGDGVVSYAMIMGDAESIDSRCRSEYSVKALEEGGMKTEKLLRQRGNWERERGRELAAKALSRYGMRLEVIFCSNDAMANGALEAVEAAGRKVGTDILLVGVDALEETVRYVKEGRITGTVLNDHVGQSHMAAETAVKLINGEKTELRYDVDYVKITTVDSIQ